MRACDTAFTSSYVPVYTKKKVSVPLIDIDTNTATVSPIPAIGTDSTAGNVSSSPQSHIAQVSIGYWRSNLLATISTDGTRLVI